jgi:hypothetical protein
LDRIGKHLADLLAQQFPVTSAAAMDRHAHGAFRQIERGNRL